MEQTEAQKEYAVIRTGGKQYRVSPGSKIVIEKIEGESGQAVTFAEVLLLGAGESIKVGTPHITGASVTGKILCQDKDKKLIAFKKKRRKGYTNKKGFRRSITRVQIEAINA